MADSERVVSTLLDRLVPSFQAVERHSTTIAVSSDQVWAAMSQVTTGELMGVRVPPGRLVGSPRARFDADEPLLGWVVRFGFSIVGEDVRRELVFGAIAQPWRLAGGRGIAIANGQDFAAFDQPGYAKIAANFRLDPITSRAVQLSTETRVACTDPTSARRFARYWRLIRPASGAIRRSWLAAIERRAERDADGEAGPRGAGALTAKRRQGPRPSSRRDLATRASAARPARAQWLRPSRVDFVSVGRPTDAPATVAERPRRRPTRLMPVGAAARRLS